MPLYEYELCEGGGMVAFNLGGRVFKQPCFLTGSVMMPASITNITVIAFTAFVAWWLSGYDPKVTGDKQEDFIRRGIRCGITLFLAAVFWGLPGALQVLPMVFFIIGLLALIWCGPLTELFARWFRHLVDPEDKREYDPNQTLRDLDAVASLIQQGRKEEAIQLCRALKETGDVSVLALDTPALERLGIKPGQMQISNPGRSQSFCACRDDSRRRKRFWVRCWRRIRPTWTRR